MKLHARLRRAAVTLSHLYTTMHWSSVEQVRVCMTSLSDEWTLTSNLLAAIVANIIIEVDKSNMEYILTVYTKAPCY